MEHEINAIEWALAEARNKLRVNGVCYRDLELKYRWGEGRQERRQAAYERECDKLRGVIAGLEAALFTVSFDIEGAA